MTPQKNKNHEPFRPSSSGSSNPPTPKPPKITLPFFKGPNPLGWIFQADNYFAYYQIPDEERVALSAFYFLDDALAWYQHSQANNLLGSWTDCKRELELRFGPPQFENHEATLLKLRQTTSVITYQTKFERLSNRVSGLSQTTLKNCFISGLKPDIQAELAIQKPTTLYEACALSKLIEDKLSFNTTNNFPSPLLPAAVSTQTSTLTEALSSPTQPLLQPPSSTHHAILSGTSSSAASATVPTDTPPPNKRLPFTKLSPEAIQQRRKEGLCFRCPEKYHPGHRCSPPQFLLIVDNDEPPDLHNTVADKNTSPLLTPIPSHCGQCSVSRGGG